MFSFFIPGKVVSEQRHRTAVLNGQPRMYDPAPNKSNKQKIREIIGEPPETYMNKEPVGVKITACFAIPKSYTKTEKEMCRSGETLPTKKPDADNIEKIVFDAMNGLVYLDDAQICENLTRKRYVSESEEEGVWVVIYAL